MKRKINFILSFFLLVGISFLTNNSSSAFELETDYDGICCQRSSGECKHPNGMTFEDATWISGSTTCTGNEDPERPLPGFEK